MDLAKRFHRMDTSLLNWYLNSNTSEDFQRWHVFPNAKEIMESFSCLRAVNRVISDPENRLYLVIGDGVMPRTALTMAYYSPWDRRTCLFVSVDPAMRTPWVGEEMRSPEWFTKSDNLHVHKCNAEHWEPSIEYDATPYIKDRIVVVAPHSHAPLLKVLHRLKDLGAEEVHVISLPCCVQDNLGAPDETWVDKDLHQHTPKSQFNYYHLK